MTPVDDIVTVYTFDMRVVVFVTEVPSANICQICICRNVTRSHFAKRQLTRNALAYRMHQISGLSLASPHWSVRARSGLRLVVPGFYSFH